MTLVMGLPWLLLAMWAAIPIAALTVNAQKRLNDRGHYRLSFALLLVVGVGTGLATGVGLALEQ